MTSILRFTCLTLVAALLPSFAAGATVAYAPPAGALPAGHYRGSLYDAVLPSGRLVMPAGTSIVTGTNALGFALSPDGRFAIVSNDDPRGDDVRSSIEPELAGGSSLTVIDVATMTVISQYRAAGETFFVGVAAVADPRAPARTLVLASGGPNDVVYAFTLDAFGRLAPDARHAIAVPGGTDGNFADVGRSGPASIVVAPGGRRAYVVDTLGNSVATIDLATRTLTGAPRATGFFPSSAALAGTRLLVTNEGLMRYGVLPVATAAPPFATTPVDPERASSLSLLDVAGGDLFALPAQTVPMDSAPDGIRIVGGAHPSAVVVTADGAFAFVAMANVDRIATVDLAGVPHVAGGTELRLFDRGPYGTQPSALALSRDGSRLYVALRGLDAIAVIDARDPLHLHRLGLIPTGWAPAALALSADDRTLFALNAHGFGADGGVAWSTLQRIDLAGVRLPDATRTALSATRTVVSAQPGYPAAIRDVVLILEEHQTFDATFGDLGFGPADPARAQFGAAVTPNLHALARRYGIAGNFFAEATLGEVGHQIVASGIATPFAERMPALAGRYGPLDASQDPEDAPRLGSVFDALERHAISFRDYGEFVRVAGYRATLPLSGPLAGLGGAYPFDVPAPAVLGTHIDANYAGWNPAIPDTERAAEFIRDYGALVQGHRAPRFAEVWLPNSGTAAGAADSDRALGAIVAYLSHAPSWHNTAVLIVPDDARGGSDHVDASRSYALVVSPFAKRGYVGMRHLSSASILKTLDGIFGLPPLSLGDLLASDLSDFFTPVADRRPYIAAAQQIGPG